MISKEFVGVESFSAKDFPAGGSPCQGLYYHIADNKPNIAFFATHYEIDFMQHYMATYLAELGYGFLGFNTRYRSSSTFFNFNNAIDDILAGILWLKDVADVNHIILLGNSGGASLMSAYAYMVPERLKVYGITRSDLQGDGFISLNAHQGRPQVLTTWMDPSITDESDPTSIDESLSMFNSVNGPPYSKTFISTYRSKQIERNHLITEWALDQLRYLEKKNVYDKIFPVFRTWADLRFLDLSIDPSKRPVGCYAGDPKVANFMFPGLANTVTLRSWLELWSLKTSKIGDPSHLQSITHPSLVIQSLEDCGCYPSDANAIFENLGTEDKKLVFLEGDHYFVDRPELRRQVAELIDHWVKERFKSSI